MLGYFENLENRIDVKKLNLKLKKKESSIVEIKKIYFSNYGYQKNNKVEIKTIITNMWNYF